MFKITLKDLDNELKNRVLSLEKLDKIIKSNSVKINAYININKKTTLIKKYITLNKIDSVQWLLNNNANPYIEDEFSIPAFFYFYKTKQPLRFIKLFKKFNLDFDYKNEYGRTILQDIILCGDIRLAKKILPLLKKPFSCDMYGKNILFDAISSGSLEMMNLIYDYEHKDKDLEIVDVNGDSLLLFFKNIGDIDKLEYLVKKGASPLIKDKNGKNIIFYFSEKLESSQSDEEIYKISRLIELTLECEELLRQKDEEGNNLLTGIVEYLNKPLSEYKQKNILKNFIISLIDRGIDLAHKNKDGYSAMLIAIEKNDIETVKILLDKGVNINEKNHELMNPLMLAVSKFNKDYFELIKLLLLQEVDINERDNEGMNVIEQIIYVIIYSKSDNNEQELYLLDLLELIVSHKNANLQLLDSQGNPYFFVLVMTDNEIIADILMRNGSKINQKNSQNKDILTYYLENTDFNNQPIQKTSRKIRKIISYGLDLDAQNEQGFSLLHRTIIDYSVDIIKCIVSCRPNLDLCDFKGRNILHTSIWTNNLDKVKYILTINSRLINEPDDFGVLPINYAVFLGSKDLACFLISKDSFVNNTFPKKESTVNFFKRFYKNIVKLEHLRNIPSSDRKNLDILLNNMRKEFNIVE